MLMHRLVPAYLPRPTCLFANRMSTNNLRLCLSLNRKLGEFVYAPNWFSLHTIEYLCNSITIPPNTHKRYSIARPWGLVWVHYLNYIMHLLCQCMSSLVQGCSISSALAMEILQSCTKQSMCNIGCFQEVRTHCISHPLNDNNLQHIPLYTTVLWFLLLWSYN